MITGERSMLAVAGITETPENKGIKRVGVGGVAGREGRILLKPGKRPGCLR